MTPQQEQSKFRSAKPSKLGRGIERLTNPFGKAMASVVPDALVEGLLKAIDKAAGLPALVRFDHDMADLAACRAAARKVERAAKAINGATGAASGFGGAISMGLDIPATFAIALRNIRDTGRAYGYDGAGEAEALFRLQILELASLADPEQRAERIAALDAAIAPDGALRPLPENGAPLVDAAVERISRAIALKSFRSKAGMIVPVVGSAIGAVVNAAFQDDVAAAARFAYQQRRLVAGAETPAA